MNLKPIRFDILRFKPRVIDPPRIREYGLRVSEEMTVMECLERIRIEQDPTLMYRHACHHASCGTCACLINGKERLACHTRVWELGSDIVTLAPLRGLKCSGDLVVEMQPFFENIDRRWGYLRPSDRDTAGSGMQRFENCIECGCCVSACPVARRNDRFLGPAALAALHRELLKNSTREQKLLELAGGARGVHLCDRVLACSRVCPGAVYPAGHIADLRGKLKDAGPTK